MDNEIAHAETIAINTCASYLRKYAEECVIYTTVEPCMMCITTIVMANIRNIVFSLEDKYLDMDHFIDSTPYIKKRLNNYLGGVMAEESTHLLKTYSPFMAEVVLNGKKPS